MRRWARGIGARARHRQGNHRGARGVDERGEPGRRHQRHAHDHDVSTRGRRMNGKTRVLLVDDEAAILRFLKPVLQANAYELTSAGTVAEALQRIVSDSPDIVVLDLGLPDADGKDFIRQVRQWSDVPIIVLSARDRESEKIEALDAGADDFVNKPFNIGELMARMRAALRHRMQRQAETPVLRAGDIEIDNLRHRVTRAGEE